MLLTIFSCMYHRAHVVSGAWASLRLVYLRGSLRREIGVSAKGSHRSCLGHCYVPHTSENHVFTKKACFSWLGIVSSFEQKVFHFQQMCLILFLLSWEDAEECGLTMGEWRMIWWINSQLPGSYIFLCLLLWHIANDTEKKKKKLFVNFVLHNPQKSHVCGLHCTGVSGKPFRQRLKEKVAVSPQWKTRLLCNAWHPGTHSPSFCRLMQPLLWVLSSPVEWRAFSSWLTRPLSCTKSAPFPPFCGATGMLMLHQGWGATGRDTVKSAEWSHLGHSLTSGAEQFLWMRWERDHWGLVIYLFFLRLTHKESPFYGCLKQLILHLFFALLAAISGNSWRYVAVSICHCCPDLLAIKRL